MSPAAKKELDGKNRAFLSRKAAQREVRRLRAQKKKVPQELLRQAGFSDGAPVSQKKRIERVVTETAPDAKTAARIISQGTFKARQVAAKELGIKNRRWMTTAELDEAINLATEALKDGKKSARLLELEQLGRERCKKAWDAWKAKQKGKKNKGTSDAG